jgi:hypothetical protein
MPIDLLEIQKNFEEKRLILGKKFGEFLLKKTLRITRFFSQVLASKQCAFFGCLLIIAISLLAQSSRDIGHDSAALLEITKKFLNGEKYYQDFLENNLPLFLYLNAFPHFLAKAFDLNLIICSEIISNLIGILTLYLSAKILSRSEICKNCTIFNLIILSFACGFFWRVFTLQFNEFGTKSTYLLALVFPYISYHLISENSLKKIDQIAIGTLAALLFCLKPNYGIFVMVFEVAKLYKKKSIISGFCLRNHATLFWLISYYILIKNKVPDYLEYWQTLAKLYYSERNFYYFFILKSEVFPVFLISFLCSFLIKKLEFLRPFFLASLAISLVVISELTADFDQRFAFYSICLPLVFLLTFLMTKNSLINWNRDWFFLVFILIVPQFDSKSSFDFIGSLCIFWWIFAIAKNKKWKDFLQEKDLVKLGFLEKILIPRTFFSWFFFLSIIFTSFALFFFKETSNLALIISGIFFVLLLFFDQKTSLDKNFSTLNSISFFAVLSYFLSLHLAAIFNFSNSSSFQYKSPNYLNDQIIKNVKNYSKKDEEITIISESIPTSYPARNYLKKENQLPFVSFQYLYSEIEKNDPNPSPTINEKDYLFSKLRQHIKEKRSQLIFIENKNSSDFGECNIGFLEYYFRNEEFKKSFFKNYVFLNQIVEVEKSDKKIEFFDEKSSLKPEESSKKITRQIEVYIRKNDK